MIIINISILIIKRSKNDQNFIKGKERNDRVRARCDSMSDVNDKHTYSSWLMYYLGTKNEDDFFSTAVKLGYYMLTKKIDHITAAAMWKESNLFKKFHKIVLRYL